MVLKRYIKNKPFGEEELKDKGRSFNLASLVGTLLVLLGSFLLTFHLFSPFLSLASNFSYLKPVSKDYFSELEKKKVGFAFRELETSLSEDINEDNPAVFIGEVFYLSIPKLGISKAVVEINSDNFAPEERLGHLRGSALPSEAGEIFIYGHSTLPVLFNPTNYKSIFSTLDKLSSGDIIEIQFAGQKYKYTVNKLEIISPLDVTPILKESLRETITLMTCHPFGTTRERILVHAERAYQ